MSLKELEFYFYEFINQVSLLLSQYIFDGESVSEQMTIRILLALLALIISLELTGFLWYRSRSFKKKEPKELTAQEKEKRLALLEKKQSKELEQRIKEEEKLQKEKEAELLAKNELREKEIQLQLEAKAEELRQNKILERDIDSTSEKDEISEVPASLIDRLRTGISKTRDQLLNNLGEVVLGKKEIDEDVLDDLEEVLIGSDIGPETTQRILDSITEKVERKELTDPKVLQSAIQQEIEGIMGKSYQVLGTNDRKPLVLLFVGVNGVGKTTTIGKIASQYRKQGKKVLMGAGDTFRAAAIEQLAEWSKRADCELFQKDAGSDPSAVMYETVQKGLEEDYDVIICDTAGRLHTKKNLMEELKKMVRVIRKLIPDAPHEVLLVLDATTGQNAIFQTREFRQATDLTGLVITKLDGTSKGGVVIGIVNEFDIPVRYIGVGEQVDDLRTFDAKEFTESLFA